MTMPSVPDPASANGFHLDKRIPVVPLLSFGLALAIQTSIIAYFLGGLAEAVKRDSTDIQRLERKIDDFFKPRYADRRKQ